MIGVNRVRPRRRYLDRMFGFICFLATALAVVTLLILLVKLVQEGLPRLNLKFLSAFPSILPDRSGIGPAIVGSLIIIAISALVTVPLGVAGAVYLEEFVVRKNRFSQFIEVNIANLAGVPSIVYGLLGLAVFVRWLAFDRSIISGAFTLSLLVLPMVIIVTREALRTVPYSIREASLALGSTRWQTIRHQVLPNALPGILTGVILSTSRAIGETAPLIVVGAFGFVNFFPKDLHSAYTVLPIQIFSWSSRPEKTFHELAASAILVLMVVLLSLNAAAILIRQRTGRMR